jgi:hypothetical protein
MSQVVVKGESVYQCDVCARKIRVPTNRYSLDVMQRCNITQTCKGVLHRITLRKEVNETPAFPPEVAGLEDWFQRKILYTHEQPVESKTWLIHHNLGNNPVFHLFVNQFVNGVVTLVGDAPYLVRTVDLNTTELTFTKARSGLVQCVTLSSTNTVNPSSTAPTPAGTAPLQITNDTGEISIATLATDNIISLTATFNTSAAVPNVDIVYATISSTPSLVSPWVSVKRIVVNGKRYTVRSFNIATTVNAPVAIEAGLIPSGSAFKFSALNGNPIALHDVLILTANSPFQSVDRVFDKYIDASSVSSINPETYWEKGKAYSSLSVVRSAYPAIIVV